MDKMDTIKKAVLEKLIEFNADIDCEDNYGWSPLHFACKLGKIDVVDKLIELGADMNCQNKSGKTPLEISIASNHPNLANHLKELGAQCDCPLLDIDDLSLLF